MARGTLWLRRRRTSLAGVVLVLTAVLAGVGAAPALAQPAGGLSAPAGRRPRPDRLTRLDPFRIVSRLALKSGDRVADIGAGSGRFARPLALAVGRDGVVYAVDNDPATVQALDQMARERELGNIRAVLATDDDPKLPEPVSLVLIINTLHHIADKPAYLKKLHASLAPGGRVAVIDFRKDWPAGHEQDRFSLADLDGWMGAAGFRAIEHFDFMPNHFFYLYQ